MASVVAENLRRHATLPDIADISLMGERSDQFIGVLLSKVVRSELMTRERSDQFIGRAAPGLIGRLWSLREIMSRRWDCCRKLCFSQPL